LAADPKRWISGTAPPSPSTSPWASLPDPAVRAVSTAGRQWRFVRYRRPMMANLGWHRTRRALAALAWAAMALGAPSTALAHHGWTWAEDVNSELNGVIVAAKLGNPHGELTLEVGGARWTVEVGQPWRNERAGLKDDMLVKGVKLIVAGHRHVDPKKRIFKAERIFIDGRKFDLYPDRD
jgi:hypothetical protein